MNYKIALIPGDGIGPEITAAVINVIRAAGVKINWEEQSAGASVLEKEGTVPLSLPRSEKDFAA